MKKVHYYVHGFYRDGSNVEEAANGEWTKAEPFHDFALAQAYRDGLEDGESFGAVLIVAAQCECAEDER